MYNIFNIYIVTQIPLWPGKVKELSTLKLNILHAELHHIILNWGLILL